MPDQLFDVVVYDVKTGLVTSIDGQSMSYEMALRVEERIRFTVDPKGALKIVPANTVNVGSMLLEDA